MIATINCGLVVRDLDRKIAFANRKMLELLGYAEHELVGSPLEILIPPEVRELALGEMKATEQGDIRARLLVIQRKDSTTFPAVMIPQRLFSEDGQLIGTCAVVVDLGAIQTAKQAGYQAEDRVRARLDRIAIELQSIGLAAGIRMGEAVSLDHPDLDELTPREKEILQLLVAGERVPSIAKQLFISQHTVRNHLKSMYRKVEVGTQSELIHRVRSLSDPRSKT